MRMPVAIFCLLLLLGVRGHAVMTGTVDELVAEIVQHAAADDMAFFSAYLDESSKGQAAQLIQQIKASGMADNFKSRLETSDTEGRLNYHDLKRGCHFQIDLAKQDGAWSIKRIWFCR